MHIEKIKNFHVTYKNKSGIRKEKGEWLSDIAFHEYFKDLKDCTYDELTFVCALFHNQVRNCNLGYGL